MNIKMKKPDYIADLHMHVIPMVDDGAKSMEMAMDMLRMSYQQGVRIVFCTSHDSAFYSAFGRAAVKRNFDELVYQCKVEMPELQAISLSLHMWKDIMMRYLILLQLKKYMIWGAIFR